MAEDILRLHHMMLQIAQYWCKPFSRWKTETEVMLEKDKGDPKIDQLRIICLYKADYNIFLKIMWAHRLVKICEEHELFDDTQSGGRPNRTSGDVAVRKMLTYAYSRVTRTLFACMDLDAKSCYDRIMASFGMLCSRYFGMPKEACILHGTTISEMQHHVKTALGISSSFFQSTPERVLYGSGQGSSRSPPLWITISIILFRTLQAQLGTGATYTCPQTLLTTNHATEASVDDSMNFINSPNYDEPYTATQLSNKLRLQNEEWERILSASGGKLELPKCLAYIVVYDWNKGEPYQQPKSAPSDQLQVRDTETQQLANISIKDLAESHKTLGTFQNPTGNSDQQSKILQQKEKKMIVFFRHSKLPTYKVNLAYHSMYTKSLQFPLGVTMMTYDTANNISKRTTRAVIGAMHVMPAMDTRIHWHKTTWTGAPTPLLRPRHFTRETGNPTHQTTRREREDVQDHSRVWATTGRRTISDSPTPETKATPHYGSIDHNNPPVPSEQPA
jgi:hypothetical protein